MRNAFTIQKTFKGNHAWNIQFFSPFYFRGDVTASVKRIVMTMEIKQKLPNESPPKLMGECDY